MWNTKTSIFCVLYPLHYIVTFGNNTNVVKVVMVKVVKLVFWKYFSRLKIVYINNILFIYTIFRTFFSHQISSLTTLTMTTLTTIYPKNLHHQKVRVKVCNHPFTLIFLHCITYLSSKRQCRNRKIIIFRTPDFS